MASSDGTNELVLPDQAQSPGANDSDLVQAVTERVYALWLRDLKFERERLGLRAQTLQRAGMASVFRRGQS